jgi:FAD/FMN-containing dehydrogenase
VSRKACGIILAAVREFGTPLVVGLQPMRLSWIKKRYDPTNLFHINQNIPPAA